jgi:hypothetical protein
VNLPRTRFLATTGALLAAVTAPTPARPARRRVRFGVNYVPSKNWWYSWGDWDRDSIRRDLDDVAALGVDHIRIQLLWPYFQPNEAYVSAAHVQRLASLLDDALERSIEVEVTVLDGQLSGFLFIPAFLIDNQNGRIGNIVIDDKLIAAEKRLFSALADAVGSHPAFLGFDISNEVYWFTRPLHIAYTPQQGDAWMQALLAHCNDVVPGKLHVNGVDKWPYEDSKPNGFTRDALLRAGAASCVHPWAGFSPIFKKYGPHGRDALRGILRAVHAGVLAKRRPDDLDRGGRLLEAMDAGRLDFAVGRRLDSKRRKLRSSLRHHLVVLARRQSALCGIQYARVRLGTLYERSQAQAARSNVSRPCCRIRQESAADTATFAGTRDRRPHRGRRASPALHVAVESRRTSANRAGVTRLGQSLSTGPWNRLTSVMRLAGCGKPRSDPNSAGFSATR